MNLDIEIETGAPESLPHSRWATLKIGGVEVFSELVFDTDQDGNRSKEQAERNLLSLFGSRLRRVLEEES